MSKIPNDKIHDNNTGEDQVSAEIEKDQKKQVYFQDFDPFAGG